MIRRFTGVVLAGGRSSRMGCDKALLEFDGRTLLDRAIAVLRDTGAARVLVSGAGRGEGAIADPFDACGPLGGLAGVVTRCEDGEVLLVVPVDMPRLDVAPLVALVDPMESSPAVRYVGHPLPWAVRVDPRFRAALRERLAHAPSAASVRGLHDDIGGVEIDPPRDADLRNVNTPEDWASLTAPHGPR